MKKIFLILVLALIVGGGSFYGGVKYSEKTVDARRRERFPDLGDSVEGSFRGRFGGGRDNGGGFVGGEIIDKDDKSITIKLRDGGSKIVFFSGLVEINKSVTGNVEDLEVGKNVMVNGQFNSDGSLTADSIQIRPPFNESR